LGHTGLTVSALGFGAARFAETYYEGPEHEMIGLLHAAREAGVTFFDTAGMYSQGRSERLIGEAFGPAYREVVIESKVGYTVSTKQKLLAQMKPFLVPVLKRLGLRRPTRRPGLRQHVTLPSDYSPRAIRNGLENSLRRLKTECLKVYLLHGLPAHERLAEAFGVMDDLKREGKILHYGASCESHDDAHSCLRFRGIGVMQVTLSLIEPERLSFIHQAKNQSIAVVARQCYASGWLTKDRTELTGGAPPAVVERIEALRAVAARHGRSLPELAFRFVHDCPDVDVTLVGVRTRRHLEDALTFMTRPPLSAAEKMELAGLGVRYDVPVA
jgi:aryl-alcohol dehydrogenase-like predicted oxidoreductase